VSPLPPGLVVAAPRSGSGKTTLTLGLLRAFARRGLAVQPFKCGPDYIDPAFHAAATGRPSPTLDTWAMTAPGLAARLESAAGADLALAEGSMGLFDGVGGSGAAGDGSNADVAAATGWPILLVLDVSGQAQSAAAVALGCARYRDDAPVAGVVLNRVASARHETLVRRGMAQVGLPVLGALPKREGLALPERHLGLVQAREQADLDARIDAMADFVEAHGDLDGVLAAARPGRPTAAPSRPPPPPGQRIALAEDAAFAFVYPHMLADWRSAGAEVIPFSPLADEAPDADADVVWLPGGYPELHAGRLAAAETFMAGLRSHAETRPVHGECGGYMALGEGLVDAEGRRHRMAGLLGLETSFATRRMHLGYRLARLLAPTPGCAAGARLRGHEFHYSTILAQPDEPLAEVTDAYGAAVTETGSRRGRVTGTFFHLIAPA
jgi:cobyrinic acid a,c-diamide synthase